MSARFILRRWALLALFSVPFLAKAQTCPGINSPIYLPSATVNTPYTTSIGNYTIGGTPPYTAFSSAVLPAGLTMNAAGAISGTPTTASNGYFYGSVVITDSCQTSPPVTIAIVVDAQPLTIDTSSLALGIQGASYNQAIQVTGGVTPYTFSLFKSSLPSGLSLNSSTGAVSGTPGATGSFSFKVEVTDSASTQAFQTITLQIDSQLVISTSSALPSAIAGQAYSLQLNTQPGTGAPNTIAWSAAPNALPAWLSLSTTGLLHGTPTATGSYTFAIQATDGISPATLNATLTVYAPLTITTAPLPNGTYGQPYGPVALRATGGSGSFSWSASGLPTGLAVTSGAISGTPTAAGQFQPIVLSVLDTVSGQSASLSTYSIAISYAPLSIATPSLPGGSYQQAYGPIALSATGGSGSYQWSASGLPTGVSITTGGVISGSPSVGGTFPVTVSLSDRVSGQTASQGYSIAIAYAPLTITQVGAGIPVGGSTSLPLTATGGMPPYKWSAIGTLPAGFTLTNGVLSGTPTQAGNLSIGVEVTDSQPVSASSTIIVNVLGFAISTLPPATAGSNYSTVLSATGGTPPYTFSATGLPSGLSISGGNLTGTVAQAGTYNFSLQVQDNAGIVASLPSSLTVNASGALSLTAPTLANGTVNVPYSTPLSAWATGGSPPYQWAVQSGSLPPGLALSGAGVLSGTPNGTGSYSFTLQATDTSGATSSAAATLIVNPPALSIATPSPLSSGIVSVVYPQQILTAAGGVAPYTYSITGGALPAGLSLNNGSIAGTPTSAGNSSFTISVTDSKGSTSQATLAIDIRPFSTDLLLSAGSLSFSIAAGATSLPAPQTVSVSSDNSGALLSFTAQAGANSSWLSVSGGSTAPNLLSIGLNSQAATLSAAGSPYAGTVTITCTTAPCSGNTQSVTVLLSVTSGPALLSAVTNILSFTATSSPPAASSQNLTLQNTGGQPLTFTSIACGAAWCQVGSYASSLGAGASASIPITADPTGLSAGYYNTTVSVASSAGYAAVPVTLLISQSGSMHLAPAGAVIEMAQGGVPGKPNGSFLINFAGTGSIDWTANVVSSANWLTLTTSSGTASGATPGTVSYSIDTSVASTLAIQPYYADIEVTAPGAVNTPLEFIVVLDVVSPNTPPSPDPQPAGLLFITPQGETPAPQTISVYTGAPTPTMYQASPSTNNGGNWLSAGPSTGTISMFSSGQSQVSVNTSSLAPGIYYGGVDYSFADPPIQTVNVTLIVTPSVPAPSVRSRSDASSAGCTPTALSLTSISLVNNFVSPATWPAAVSILLVDDCGNAVSNGQIVVTFSNGDPPLALSLADGSTGLYSGTWTPTTPGPQVTLTAQATAPGFPATSVLLSGQVTPNVAPVLNANGTLHVFTPQVGGALAPGTIVQIYGSGLAAGNASATDIPLPTSLNGTSVAIGGMPAPLYFVSPGQINAQIPFGLNPNSQYEVIAEANGALTTPISIQIAPVTPGFAAYSDGTLIAQHAANNSLITAQSPAQPGEYVVAYLAGMGQTTVPVQTGNASPSDPLAWSSVTPVLTLNGASAPVLYWGLTPGLVGLYQVDFQVPAGTPNGTLTVVLSQDAFGANVTTIPVQQ